MTPVDGVYGMPQLVTAAEMPKKPKGFCDSQPCSVAYWSISIPAEMPKKPKGFCDKDSFHVGFVLVDDMAEMPKKPKGFCDRPPIPHP